MDTEEQPANDTDAEDAAMDKVTNEKAPGRISRQLAAAEEGILPAVGPPLILQVCN